MIEALAAPARGTWTTIVRPCGSSAPEAGGGTGVDVGSGVGVLGGSLLLARWGPSQGRGRWIVWSLPVGGVAFLLAGLAPSIVVAMAFLLVLGLGAAVFINFSTTLLQTYAEPRYIGRVMSVSSLAFMAAVPLGNLHAGITQQLWDPRVVFLYSGALAAALGLLALARLHAARTLD